MPVKWIAKAAVQRGLSAVPGGSKMNYLLQQTITNQFPRSDEHFRLHASETVAHLEAFSRHSDVESGSARFFEFGAGWDLITPIMFHGLGVTHQTLVDIRPNLRFEQVSATLSQYDRLRQDLERDLKRTLRPVDPSPVRSLVELRERFGIAYLAPCDARGTGLPDESFDFTSSPYTLEHIPPGDITAILAECRRLLRPGGLASSIVDMQDHFSFFDPSITAFNFLKFSDRVWSAVNSSLHYQNRLREPDYRALHESAGLPVLEARSKPIEAADIEAVRGLRLASRFRKHYTEDELVTREVRILAHEGKLNPNVRGNAKRWALLGSNQ